VYSKDKKHAMLLELDQPRGGWQETDKARRQSQKAEIRS
jgi:hypothetical protein